MENIKETTEQKQKNHNDFLELCKYIETEIFNYEPNQKLQRAAVLRLRGLTRGQNIANNKHQQFGEYSYEVILLTFKAYKTQILNAIRNKNFDSEANKVAYISAIIRDKLNDMATRVLNAQKSQEKVENIDTSIMEYEGAGYQSSAETKKDKDKKWDDMW